MEAMIKADTLMRENINATDALVLIFLIRPSNDIPQIRPVEGFAPQVQGEYSLWSAAILKGPRCLLLWAAAGR